MHLAPNATDPAQLSYFALRRAVRGIALGLPFAVAIPWFLYTHTLEGSISYYYTGMRNLFEGSLCAIARFQLFCRGYDQWDELAGILSGVFALAFSDHARRWRHSVPKVCWNGTLYFCRTPFLDPRRLLPRALQNERSWARTDSWKGSAKPGLHRLRNRDPRFHGGHPAPY